MYFPSCKVKLVQHISQGQCILKQSGNSTWKKRITCFLFFQAVESRTDSATTNIPQLLPRSLLNSWELEESQVAQGGYAAHLLPFRSSNSSGADTHPLLSDILSRREDPSLPLLLFLTHRHLWVLKIDFRELTNRERKDSDVHHSSWCRLVRVPLGSVVVHTRQISSQAWDGESIAQCTDPKHHCRSLSC